MNLKSQISILITLILSTALMNCTQKKKSSNGSESLKVGTYGYDRQFLSENEIKIHELKDPDSEARVLLSPEYQGRVITSSAEGVEGMSFGWINYDFIVSKEVSPQFNPIGGEERFWLGPEGGPFSIYFPPKVDQEFENWVVPPSIDTKPFAVASKSSESIIFTSQFDLKNASGTSMKVGVEREVSIFSREKSSDALGLELDDTLDIVAYQSSNKLINRGAEKWSSTNGFLSIWLLSMFKPSEKGVVFIPYQEGSEDSLGVIANDDYFGKVPADRLIADSGILYFKVDGKKRSKIGLSSLRAKNVAGSYDEANKHLTILWYSKPKDNLPYVNSKWGDQNNPLKGDAINSYNDGPVADGSIMGPFYELESSSPAALLSPGENITHTQRIFHICGDEAKLNKITESLFGVEIEQIQQVFKNQ